jgi:hypothetical protein
LTPREALEALYRLKTLLPRDTIPVALHADPVTSP